MEQGRLSGRSHSRDQPIRSDAINCLCAPIANAAKNCGRSTPACSDVCGDRVVKSADRRAAARLEGGSGADCAQISGSGAKNAEVSVSEVKNPHVHMPVFSDDPLSWKGACVLSVSQFSVAALRLLVHAAEFVKANMESGRRVTTLQGQVVACVFFEPSTRTSSSFQAAIQRLGGAVIAIAESHSSTVKGESLEDTIRSLACYSSGIVLRHQLQGAALLAATTAAGTPVINAGDGVGEHPTQALLDFYTLMLELHASTGCDIHNPCSALQGRRIVIVGDLKHGRTVHSLAQLLGMFEVRV